MLEHPAALVGGTGEGSETGVYVRASTECDLVIVFRERSLGGGRGGVKGGQGQFRLPPR